MNALVSTLPDNPYGQLGPAERTASLAALANGQVDLVVIGGGVTGAGCALDAAARGLSVVLLEKSDIAAGTSSRSSKLIHGGLRYLAQWRFGLVREALRERSLIVSRLAPHLVHPVSFLYLLERSKKRSKASRSTVWRFLTVWRWLLVRLSGAVHRFYVNAGVLLYDLLARVGVSGLAGASGLPKSAALPRHKNLSADQAQKLAPGLDASAHRGAVQYWDAQTDDARYTLALARTAAAFGAYVLTSVEVTKLEAPEGDAPNGDAPNGDAFNADAPNGDAPNGDAFNADTPNGDAPNGDAFNADTPNGDVPNGTGYNGVTTVFATDRETGKELRIRATAVINATGVWSDDVDALARVQPASTARVQPAGTARVQPAGPSQTVRVSKGIHIVIERDRIAANTGVVFPTNTSVLFIIPWSADAAASNNSASNNPDSGNFTHWIIGTTDTDWKLDRTHPAASRSDINYLLDEANRFLAKPLTEDDICGVYAGLRPLLTDEDPDTSKLSREHSVMQIAPGMVSVKGGKYTTYRVMAADAVDAAVQSAGLEAPSADTANVPLLGAQLSGSQGWSQMRLRGDEIAGGSGISLAAVMHLLGRHGDQAPAVIELITADPSLAQPLVTECGYLRAEVVYAARAEGALHLDDVLARRTRLSVETPDRAVGVAELVAELMAPELGWSSEQTADEVRYYVERVAAERASQTRDSDLTASAARLVAADARQLGPR